jgi:cysteine desulfuration protein SufE
MTVAQKQNDIVNEFAILDGDQEMTLFYIMELGQKLPAYPEAFRTEEYIVKGCQSKVWIRAYLDHDKVVFEGDSNTAITKGLVSLLIRILSNQTPEAILHADLFFMNAIKMDRFIGTQRSNGFASMVKQMKLYALAFKTKMETAS